MNSLKFLYVFLQINELLKHPLVSRSKLSKTFEIVRAFTDLFPKTIEFLKESFDFSIQAIESIWIL